MKKKEAAAYIGDFGRLLRDPVFIKYIVKCLIGSSLCYFPYHLFPQHQLNWSIISVLLVLAPEHADSVKLALDRMKANIIGAGIGLLIFLVGLPEFAALSLSVLLTILVCYFLKLKTPSRSALAALIIVLIQEQENNTAAAAFERMGCVVLGCAVGLLVTFLFSLTEKKRYSGSDPSSADGE